MIDQWVFYRQPIFTEPPHHKICWKQSRIQTPLPDVDRGSDYKLSIGFHFLYLLQNTVSGRNSSNFWITNLSTIIYHHKKNTQLGKSQPSPASTPLPTQKLVKHPIEGYISATIFTYLQACPYFLKLVYIHTSTYSQICRQPQVNLVSNQLG